MKKLFYSIKDKIVTTYHIDMGVVILFSAVTMMFLVSLVKIYI